MCVYNRTSKHENQRKILSKNYLRKKCYIDIIIFSSFYRDKDETNKNFNVTHTSFFTSEK